MGDMKAVVRYLEARKTKAGTRYYYCPPAAAVAARVVARAPLGGDLAEAVAKAEGYNRALDAWRRGEEQAAAVVPGSIAHLIAAFQKSRDYPSRAKTRSHYDWALGVLEKTTLEGNRTLGQVLVRDLRPKHVLALRDILARQATKGTGERRASAAITLGRRLFEWGRKMGLAPHENPWSRPGLKATPYGGRVWSPEEFRRFVAAARALGHHSIALAALMTRDLCQRPGDVLKMTWSAWDAEGQRFVFRQSKTGQEIKAPASVALAAEMAKMTPGAPDALIITSDRRGVAISEFRLAHLVADIRAHAGLPAEVRFKDLRHTGLTEMGEAGADLKEIQSISGHTTVQIVHRYVRNTSAAAEAAVRKREDLRGRRAAKALPPPPKALPAPEPRDP
jgi:integrase